VSSQKRVVVVEANEEEHLDQDLCCFTCEEGLDPADVVETNSTRSGHRSDDDQHGWSSSTTPWFLAVGSGETSMSSMVTSGSI